MQQWLPNIEVRKKKRRQQQPLIGVRREGRCGCLGEEKKQAKTPFEKEEGL